VPPSFRDRYQDTPHELVEGEDEGLVTTPRALADLPKVINLTEALKRSLARDAEPEPKKAAAGKPTRAKDVPDRGHRAMLLPVSGGRGETDVAVAEPAASTPPKRRERAG
jgi:hypothetical protein